MWTPHLSSESGEVEASGRVFQGQYLVRVIQDSQVVAEQRVTIEEDTHLDFNIIM